MLLVSPFTRRSVRYLVCLLFALVCQTGELAVLPLRAQSVYRTQDHYTKREIAIPMRDGVRLYTVIFTPKDADRASPILMERTPYSIPYGAEYPSGEGWTAPYLKNHYILVYQDVRGKFMSEGEYENVRPLLTGKPGPKETDESTDTYDTIEWLIKNVPNNNGRVGIYGISYPGFYAMAGAVHAHPALKAVSPQAPVTDWFLGDDLHHNGAFFLMDNFSWDFDTTFDYPRPVPTQEWGSTGNKYDSDSAYDFYLKLGPLKNANTKYFHNKIPFWNDLMQHSTYDAYWKAHSLLPHIKEIKSAVMLVSGWFDAEDLSGPQRLFRALSKNSPQTPFYFVVGPWPHGGWSEGDWASFGDIPFHAKTGVLFREKIEFPFFDYYLRGVGERPASRVQVFTTGSNQWLRFDTWPPRNLTPHALYFHPAQRLDSARTRTKAKAGKEVSDAFVSDPAHPVPYANFPGVRRNSDYMIADQRFAATRPDVLTYQTAPLKEDMTVIGPVTADLYVATSGTDADWVVKVIDVYPENATESESASGKVKMGGYQQLVRGDVMRGRFRNSFEKPEAFVPNQVTRLKFDLPDLCHTFRKGHRLMVQVQSSWFPLVDRNPQKFVEIRSAEESDFQAATNRLYHTAAYPSRIVFGVR